VSECHRNVSINRKPWPNRGSVHDRLGYIYIHIHNVKELVMMNCKFERMRKNDVVIFYLLSRNVISGAVLQHLRSVVTKERTRLQPSQDLHRKFYCMKSPGYLLCPVSIFIFVVTAVGTDWWCRCDMVAQPQPSQLCT